MNSPKWNRGLIAVVCLVLGTALAGCPRTSDPDLPDSGEPDSGEPDSGDSPQPDAGHEPPVDAELEEWATQSAEAKIAAASRAGLIDTKTKVLYLTFAALAPTQLPPQYQSSTDIELPASVGAIAAARSYYSQYTAAEQAQLDAIFVPPTSGRYHAFANNYGTSARCWDAAVDGGVWSAPIDTVHFRFFAGSNTGNLANVTARLTAALNDMVTVDDGVLGGTHPLSQHFDDGYTEISKWGFTLPTANALLTSVQDAGQNQRIPVYVVDCPASGGAENATAYPEGHVMADLGLVFEDRELRKVVLLHEVAHVFTYDFWDTGDDHLGWPYEAMAVTVEDELVRDVRRFTAKKPPPATRAKFYKPMSRSFMCPEEPFHSANEGPCETGLEGRDSDVFPGRSHSWYRGDYSKFTFFKWWLHRPGAGRDQQTRLGAWWAQYRAAGGDPTGVVLPKDIADYQLALVSHANVTIPTAPSPTIGDLLEFTQRDTLLFENPDSELDAPPGLRLRYTWRFEEPQFLSHRWRLAPPQVASQGDPMSPNNSNYRMRPGATYRVMVATPRVPILPEPPVELHRVATLVFKHDAPAMEVRGNYVYEEGGLPSRRRWAGMGDFAEALDGGFLPLVPNTGISAAPKFFLMTFTAPATLQSNTTLDVGVTIGHQCMRACVEHYTPVSRACCPDYCYAPDQTAEELRTCIDEDCSPQEMVMVRLLAWCSSMCGGYATRYSLTDETVNMDLEARMCRPADVPLSTPSGLVPITGWLTASCDDLETPSSR